MQGVKVKLECDGAKSSGYNLSWQDIFPRNILEGRMTAASLIVLHHRQRDWEQFLGHKRKDAAGKGSTNRIKNVWIKDIFAMFVLAGITTWTHSSFEGEQGGCLHLNKGPVDLHSNALPLSSTPEITHVSAFFYNKGFWGTGQTAQVSDRELQHIVLWVSKLCVWSLLPDWISWHRWFWVSRV